ncbi:hypothetical protein B0T16DRAFT_462188 [Cercophora newfieldiana]|uniref:RING-type domain-containing protein n=1 Tax=Cercophora newfieldiana TaxID=92897 RepID=A0AA40CKE1_9PEZI|nr:hypothetical protein B0T16DRAFT_462188 [Cercophora newfieldiana]
MSHPGGHPRQDDLDTEDVILALAIQESLVLANRTEPPSRPPQLTPTSTSQPPATTETIQETIEETVWANIEKYIQTPRGPQPIVTCAICRNELIIPGLQEENGEREAMRKLPCGHVLGKDCAEQWIETRITDHSLDDNTPQCPFCRAPIISEGEVQRRGGWVPGQYRMEGQGLDSGVEQRGGEGEGRGIYFDGERGYANFPPTERERESDRRRQPQERVSIMGSVIGLGPERVPTSGSSARRQTRREERREVRPRTSGAHGDVREVSHPSESRQQSSEPRAPNYPSGSNFNREGRWVGEWPPRNGLQPSRSQYPSGPYPQHERAQGHFQGSQWVGPWPPSRDVSSPNPTPHVSAGSHIQEARHPSESNRGSEYGSYTSHSSASPTSSSSSGSSRGYDVVDAHHPYERYGLDSDDNLGEWAWWYRIPKRS